MQRRWHNVKGHKRNPLKTSNTFRGAISPTSEVNNRGEKDFFRGTQLVRWASLRQEDVTSLIINRDIRDIIYINI